MTGEAARVLGASGETVSAMGLGCMGMSQSYGVRDDAESIATLHRALELGCTFWDTADMYGAGKNEELLAQVLKDRRAEVFLATKFAIRGSTSGEFSICGKPEYVQEACEASLKRLGADVIDLYYYHRVDPETPIEDTAGAMQALVEQGKVRYLGLSEAAPDTIRRAHAIHPITALQTEYSLWSRDPEDGLLELCAELGIAFVAYSPLGRGFLTGQITRFEDLAKDDWRRISPRFQGNNFKKNLDLVNQVETLAEEKGCTPAQLALAWVLAQPGNIIPIPGTKRRKYLEQNWHALDVELSAEDNARIDAIAPKGGASGERYPASMMTFLNG